MSSYECKKLKFPGNFDHLNLSIMTFSFMLYLRINVSEIIRLNKKEIENIE